MFTASLKEYPDIVGIACEGSLTDDDLYGIHILLQESLASAHQPGLVVDLSRFTGYSDPETFSEYVRIDIIHWNDFSRIAIVGDQKWMELGVAVASFLTRAEMRWFDAGEAEQAVEWARRA